MIDLNNSYVLAQQIESVNYQYIEYIYPVPRIIEYSVVETNIYKFYYGNDGEIYKVNKVEPFKIK